MMVEVAFGDKAEQEGLEAIKALSKHSKRVQFDDRNQAEDFVEDLKTLSEGQNFTYRYKSLDVTQAAPQIQVMSTE
jgi:folate-binding Fe-S cluster repair protein YgfZ